MMTVLAEDLERGLNYLYTDKANIGTIESAYILETVTLDKTEVCLCLRHQYTVGTSGEGTFKERGEAAGLSSVQIVTR